MTAKHNNPNAVPITVPKTQLIKKSHEAGFEHATLRIARGCWLLTASRTGTTQVYHSGMVPLHTPMFVCLFGKVVR